MLYKEKQKYNFQQIKSLCKAGLLARDVEFFGGGDPTT